MEKGVKGDVVVFGDEDLEPEGGICGVATPGAWANQAHLPYLSHTSKYKIVALANSSVAAAEAAIKEHNLPADVKAYGSPEDIAADPDVDMVVVSVTVTKHYELVKPALEAGKTAFVEWPLGCNTAQAEELTELAKRKNVKTLVGLQGRQTNITRTLKEIVASGKLGKVLSSTVVTESGFFDHEIPVKMKYFTEAKNGGNNYTILFGHFVDSFVDVLGDFEHSQGILANQRPFIDLVSDGKKVETVHKDIADHILVQGKLKSGAVTSISVRTTHQAVKRRDSNPIQLRAGKPPHMTWKIFFERGEVSLEAPGPSVQWSYEKDMLAIKQFDYATEKVETIDVADMELEDIKTPSRMIGRVYEAFASGREYPTFEHALENHRRLDRIAESAIHLEREFAEKCPEHEEAILASSRTTDEIQQPFAPVPPGPPMINVQEELLSRPKSKELRRMPQSYRDLKAAGSKDQVCSELLKPSLKTPELLPSPLPSEGDDNYNGCFAFRNPKEAGPNPTTFVESSYEFEGIVMGYCEDNFRERASRFRSPLVGGLERQRCPATTPPKQPVDSYTSIFMRTPPTSNMSATLRSPKRERSASLSSEATWLSKSYSSQDSSTCFGQLERIKTSETRLAEKSRRCCQIVPGPIDDWPTTSCPGVRKACYATVINPGKASDIWVPRPSPMKSRSTNRSSPGESQHVPGTPERKLFEISAFSPWDSPTERQSSAQYCGDTSSPFAKIASYGNLNCPFKQSTPSRSTVLPPRKSSLSAALRMSPISVSPSFSTSTLASVKSPSESLSRSAGGAQQVVHPECEAWAKCEDIARILDDLERSVNEYPSGLLQLDTPVVLQIRHPQSLDEVHMSCLSKIFPAVHAQHLSALAATLIAQSYLTRLSPDAEQSISIASLAATSNQLPNNITTKTGTTLGIHLADVTSVHVPAQALRKRAIVVQAALHVSVRKIMIMTSNPNHHFIPLDVTSWSSQLSFFEDAVRLSPTRGIDCVVANAGINLAEESLTFEKPPDYHSQLVTGAQGKKLAPPAPPQFKTVDVNLTGVLTTCNPKPDPNRGPSTAKPEVNRDRHLLLIASIAGLWPLPTQTLYSVSKHGVVGLFRNLRVTSPVRHGIRVNMLCPYFTATPILGTAGKLMLSGAALAEMRDVVDAATRLVADRTVVGRGLAVGARAGAGDAESVGGSAGEGESGVWEVYAHDFEQSDVFSRRVLAVTNLVAGRRGWVGVLSDLGWALVGEPVTRWWGGR
ncbi:hypothetical protein EPUS_08225 [Endocarpon pusillum Z07020]|uniref:Uncharacterized protein n=1 Tax=Endocarpon pusillum (strain Z07020 / HMAS-L-300199) TaxID=1263415 RepID=U1HRX1_ENDPU|nr:uncharacterized protein EPUS_08225 [Endocarpon pusillum Z07020]ERF71909.1 hypothetical protein EPUS_08225 [Endocarpon pusillum Z07020]